MTNEGEEVTETWQTYAITDELAREIEARHLPANFVFWNMRKEGFEFWRPITTTWVPSMRTIMFSQRRLTQR